MTLDLYGWAAQPPGEVARDLTRAQAELLLAIDPETGLPKARRGATPGKLHLGGLIQHNRPFNTHWKLTQHGAAVRAALLQAR